MSQKETKTYEATIRGRKTRVTIPEPPTLQEILADAIRECLSPEAVATIVMYLQPAEAKDPQVVREVQWFSGLLTQLVGGPDDLKRLAEELGL